MYEKVTWLQLSLLPRPQHDCRRICSKNYGRVAVPSSVHAAPQKKKKKRCLALGSFHTRYGSGCRFCSGNMEEVPGLQRIMIPNSRCRLLHIPNVQFSGGILIKNMTSTLFLRCLLPSFSLLVHALPVSIHNPIHQSISEIQWAAVYHHYDYTKPVYYVQEADPTYPPTQHNTHW